MVQVPPLYSSVTVFDLGGYTSLVSPNSTRAKKTLQSVPLLTLSDPWTSTKTRTLISDLFRVSRRKEGPSMETRAV